VYHSQRLPVPELRLLVAYLREVLWYVGLLMSLDQALSAFIAQDFAFTRAIV
jgi:hypothetical protein